MYTVNIRKLPVLQIFSLVVLLDQSFWNTRFWR